MVDQYIAKWTILDLCMDMEWRPGSQLSNSWCERAVIKLVGAWNVVIWEEGGRWVRRKLAGRMTKVEGNTVATK